MFKYFLFILLISKTIAQPYLFNSAVDVPLYAVYETAFPFSTPVNNPYIDIVLKVEFTNPDGESITVDGFYVGENLFKVRAYCSLTGNWYYKTKSNIKELNNLKGEFKVTVPKKHSKLKGKLRICYKDSRQFVYDNGDWFLHIGDTGYRYAAVTEPFWKEYIDQSVAMGATKIRVWFCQSRHSIEDLLSDNGKKLNLKVWREIDKRLSYALNNHPNIILQLIPYGEDSEAIKKYDKGDFMIKYIGQYAQARWSSFPNIYWCLTNDRVIYKEDSIITSANKRDERNVHYDMINKIGNDFYMREPWGSLITNHQARFTGYDFINEPWSDIVTLEELDGINGKKILEYRKRTIQPILNDEDRYALYRSPENRRYFFRRLMWASLLSSGAATYGGGNTWLPYREGTANGVQGYYTLNRKGLLFQGAHDFKYIHKFFKESGLTLINMHPDDKLVGGKPQKWKCSHDMNNYIIYIANPSGSDPQKDNPANLIPKVNIRLLKGKYSVSWYDPALGTWQKGHDIIGGLGKLTLSPPSNAERGDRILLIRRKKSLP